MNRNLNFSSLIPHPSSPQASLPRLRTNRRENRYRSTRPSPPRGGTSRSSASPCAPSTGAEPHLDRSERHHAAVCPAAGGDRFLQRFLDFFRIESILVDLARRPLLGECVLSAEGDLLRLPSKTADAQRQSRHSRAPRDFHFAVLSAHLMLLWIELHQNAKRLLESGFFEDRVPLRIDDFPF